MTETNSSAHNEKRVLVIIVISQFLCTSIWFASNAVIDQLVTVYGFADDSLSVLTSAVQFGFIVGTLTYALFNLTDQYSPSKVFLLSAVLGALFNVMITVIDPNLLGFAGLRFFVGFFLAGIYPVGMKIAADYFKNGLGHSLGLLVGALVIGTALPHLLRGTFQALDWQLVFIVTSMLCTTGGLLIYWLVPDGPYRNPAKKIELGRFLDIFKNKQFRSAAIGYFGHMWELYTFWAFVPLIIQHFQIQHPKTTLPLNPAFLAFLIIAVGALACYLSGRLSQRFAPQKIAYLSLFGSMLCCIMTPWLLMVDEFFILYVFLLLWGILVVADSPMFSTLVAHSAPADLKGSALTLVNCIGFGLTIVSIQMINWLSEVVNFELALSFLAIGPFLALINHLCIKNR
ncbi:MFS transporter [Reichenbachiella agarivorans]|uniref:MFS transporter n=1 Tax=Reichenbachiella agarivorans TaxID=2979464 RepID=A0ABY6CR64_9BACT|nr:MFS transporter [Reichenbachiella agarivorans]UXP30795.1 MFS transporter [Reichenbachiella agarivorans]